MGNLKIYLTRLTLILFLLSGISCQYTKVQGQFINDNQINQINNRQLDQEEIIEMIGLPTYIPDYSPISMNTWYYIHRLLVHRAWFNQTVVAQRILKITFTMDKKISEVVLLKDSHNESLAPSGIITTIQGLEQSSVQKLIKNLGKFNQANVKNSRVKSVK